MRSNAGVSAFLAWPVDARWAFRGLQRLLCLFGVRELAGFSEETLPLACESFFDLLDSRLVPALVLPAVLAAA